MNLKENIYRIQSLILKEDLETKIRKLIDKFGFSHVYGIMGDVILKYITNDEKIEFIKNKLKEISEEFGGSGISVHELNREPILYGETNNELRQIEYFNQSGVYVDVYDLDTDSHIGDFRVMYESLKDNILNDVFEFFIDE